MKRCPTCNRTFEEDWLAFCTQDGATLVDDSPSSRSSEPPPTILSPPPPPPGGWKAPSGDLGSGQFQSQPIPPPPPQSNTPAPSGGFGLTPFQQPQQNTGKPFAIVGIATAAGYFFLLAVFILIYGVAIFMGGLNK